MSNSTGFRTEQLDRREFLTISSGVIGAALFTEPIWAEELGQELPTHGFRVRRDSDLLSLEFSFVNFERRGDMLLSLGAARSLVIVRFPPQNIAEARFDKAAGAPEHNPDDPWPGAGTPPAGFEEQPLPDPPNVNAPSLPLPVLPDKATRTLRIRETLADSVFSDKSNPTPYCKPF